MALDVDSTTHIAICLPDGEILTVGEVEAMLQMIHKRYPHLDTTRLVFDSDCGVSQHRLCITIEDAAP